MIKDEEIKKYLRLKYDIDYIFYTKDIYNSAMGFWVKLSPGILYYVILGEKGKTTSKQFDKDANVLLAQSQISSFLAGLTNGFFSKFSNAGSDYLMATDDDTMFKTFMKYLILVLKSEQYEFWNKFEKLAEPIDKNEVEDFIFQYTNAKTANEAIDLFQDFITLYDNEFKDLFTEIVSKKSDMDWLKTLYDLNEIENCFFEALDVDLIDRIPMDKNSNDRYEPLESSDGTQYIGNIFYIR